MFCALSDPAIVHLALEDHDPTRAAPEPSPALTTACIAVVNGALGFAIVLGL